MTKKRAGSMDQTSSWTFDAAGAPGKLRRSPMASPGTWQNASVRIVPGVIRGMSGHMLLWRGSASRPDRKHGMMIALHCLVLP
jgi:hypothetical protein